MFWVHVDAEVTARGTVMTFAVPRPGDTIHLADLKPYTVGRVEPAPLGSHIVKGTIYATSAGRPDVRAA